MSTKDTDEAIWHMIRSKLQHEDSWIQQRVSWHLATNAFLFSAYAIVVVSASSGVGEIPPAISVLLLLIPGVGTLFSSLNYLGVLAAGRTVRIALHEWDILGPAPKARTRLPLIFLDPSSLRLARFATTGISLTAISMWLVLLAVSVALLLTSGSR